jgi:hypothetical protein
MIGRWLVCSAALAAAMLAAAPAAARSESRQMQVVEARLEAALVEALRADGPFFTAQERALIERACAYPAGSWNGYEFSMTDGVLHCTNGLDVDTPEVRAMMDVAAPRIGRRVAAAMARPRVRSAVAAVSRLSYREASRDRMHMELYLRDPQRQTMPSPSLPSR